MLTWHSGAVSYLPNTQWRKLCLAVGFVTLAAACTQDASPLAADAPTTVTSRADRSETDASPSSTAPIQSSTSTVVVPTTATVAPTTTTTVEQRPFGSPSPEWLGTRLLPLRPSDGLGVATPTPAELVDRELWTVDVLEAPASNEFVSSLTTPPPNEVLVRSTWRQECPVGIDELTYGQVSFYGFDGLFHTGEFLVHRDFGEGIVDTFRRCTRSVSRSRRCGSRPKPMWTPPEPATTTTRRASCVAMRSGRRAGRATPTAERSTSTPSTILLSAVTSCFPSSHRPTSTVRTNDPEWSRLWWSRYSKTWVGVGVATGPQ